MRSDVLVLLTRRLWLPSLLAVLGSALAIGLSDHFERERREEIGRSARAIAAEARAAIALKVDRHVGAVSDLASVWSRFGGGTPAEWVESAQLVMRNVAGFSYIAWVPLGGDLVRLAPAPNGRSVPSVDRAAALSHVANGAIVGPERRPDGGASYRLYLPVREGAGAAGVLEAGVDVDALLESVLRNSAPGYAISIFWGSEPILERGRPAGSPDVAWWREEGPVPLAFGTEWRVVHEPTAELAAASLTPLASVLGFGGVVLSLALGVIVYQLGRARESEAALRRLSDELEGRVRSRTRALEDAMSDLEAFTFSASHDLRAPIGAVLNFVAILEEEHVPNLPLAAREIVTRIRANAERSIGLLEGLLKLSRAGRAELAIEVLDMTELAREAFAQACGGEDEGAAIELVVQPLPPARGDRALIGSVFVNLLANAVKYTRGCEKRRIVVSGQQAESANIYAVADNGVGFDTRDARKLFGAFERLHPADRFEGAGIGLAIVARIVKRHGGRVWADGRPGEGATFFFSLAATDPWW